MNRSRATALRSLTALSALFFGGPVSAQSHVDLPAQRLPAAQAANTERSTHGFDADDSWGLVGLPVRGPADALVTIVEFSDFECPFCSRAAPVMDQLQEVFPDDVRVVFVQMPLSFHSNAHRAAQASLAAHAQGLFWPYHDLLFENQHQLGEDDLLRRAEEAGLDTDTFFRDLQNEVYLDEVDRQVGIATRLGVRGTPNFFVNGQNIRGAQPFEVFRAAVVDELAEARALMDQGLSRPEIYQQRRDLNLADSDEPAVVAQPARPAEPPSFAAADLPATPYFRGPEDALVTIIEFTDYQCPYCSRANSTIEDLVDANDDVRVVIRHNPLSFHQRADEAAAAAVAAGAQGMFWEYHDLLFGSGSTLEDAQLEGFAEELGLDVDQWQADRVSQATREVVAADQGAAVALNASGTPQFFINGERIRGAQPFEAFQNAVNAARTRAEAALEDGTEPAELYDVLMENVASLNDSDAADIAPDPIDIDTGSAPTLGDVDAPIELVVFTDFQCPFCVRFASTAFEFAQENDDVRLSIMHFPLPFHSDAHLAAQASVEAAEQGLFWEFYDVLHDNGTTVDRDSLIRYGRQIGMDVEALESALDSQEHASVVDGDMAAGSAAGVRGTPSWFVNGVFHSGAHPRAYVENAVDSARSALDD